jgi:dihydroorotase
VGKGTAREGTLALQLGLPGNPAMSETAPLAALLELVGAIGTPVHVMHVSTARGVALVRRAKAEGLPITASTTWMHVIGSVASLAGYDPSWRLDPPVGNPVDREVIQQAIQDGTLDAIAIHHSPYTYEEKTVAFGETPPGAIGLELALPLLWEQLVGAGVLSPLALLRALTIGPAACLKQSLPGLQVGQAAELLLFDPEVVWVVGEGTLRSKSFNTPWLGREIRGRVVRTVVPDLK